MISESEETELAEAEELPQRVRKALENENDGPAAQTQAVIAGRFIVGALRRGSHPK